MKIRTLQSYASWAISAICCLPLFTSCSQPAGNAKEAGLVTVGNPYLPLWEHIPDGEPMCLKIQTNRVSSVSISMAHTTISRLTIVDAIRWFGQLLSIV